MQAAFSLKMLGAFVTYVACAAAAFASTSDSAADLFLMLNGALALFALSAALFSSGAYRVKAIGFLLWAGLYLVVLWAFPESAPSSRLGDDLGAAWVPANAIESKVSQVRAIENAIRHLKDTTVGETRQELELQQAKLEAQLAVPALLSQMNRFVTLHAAMTMLIGCVGAAVAAHHHRMRTNSRGVG